MQEAEPFLQFARLTYGDVSHEKQHCPLMGMLSFCLHLLVDPLCDLSELYLSTTNNRHPYYCYSRRYGSCDFVLVDFDPFLGSLCLISNISYFKASHLQYLTKILGRYQQRKVSM